MKPTTDGSRAAALAAARETIAYSADRLRKLLAVCRAEWRTWNKGRILMEVTAVWVELDETNKLLTELQEQQSHETQEEEPRGVQERPGSTPPHAEQEGMPERLPFRSKFAGGA